MSIQETNRIARSPNMGAELKEKIKLEARAFAAHHSPISGIAANGKYVATAGYDNKVILWDCGSKQPVAVAMHDHLVNQVSFSLCGKYLFTASSDATARRWSTAGLQLLNVYGCHDDDVEMIADHPTDEFVATASRDSYVRIFSRTGTLIHKLSGHTSDVISVAWSPDGQSLFSSGDDGKVIKWNPASGELLKILDLGGVETDTVVVGADDIVYAGTDDGTIVVFLDDGSSSEIAAHDAGVKRLIFNRAENQLASLGYDGMVNVWSIDRSGFPAMSSGTQMPSDIWARSAAFVTDTSLVFGTFGSSYAQLNLEGHKWDLNGVEPTKGVNALGQLNGTVYSAGDSGLVFSKGTCDVAVDGPINFIQPFCGELLIGGHLGQISNSESEGPLYQHPSPLNCSVAYVINGVAKAICGAYTGEGIVVQSRNGKSLVERTIRLHKNAVKGLSQFEGVICSVAADGEIAFHNAENYDVIYRKEVAHQKIANDCDAVPGTGFVSVSRDLMMRLWTANGELISEIDTPHTHSIKCVCTSDDGRYIATGSYGGHIAIYDLENKTWVSYRRFATSGISSLLSISKNSFVAGSYDGELYSVSV